MAGRFPVSKELALEMAGLMAQVRGQDGQDATLGLLGGITVQLENSADSADLRHAGVVWYGKQQTTQHSFSSTADPGYLQKAILGVQEMGSSPSCFAARDLGQVTSLVLSVHLKEKHFPSCLHRVALSVILG